MGPVYRKPSGPATSESRIQHFNGPLDHVSMAIVCGTLLLNGLPNQQIKIHFNERKERLLQGEGGGDSTRWRVDAPCNQCIFVLWDHMP